jgi:hypothetical protein
MGKGKPCGASFISAQKTCRIGLSNAVEKALNAASGEIGAATVWAGIREHAKGNKDNEKKALEIRNEVRKEMGGNVVRGPKADEFRRRLRAEGVIQFCHHQSIDQLKFQSVQV